MNPRIECPWCAEPADLGEPGAIEFRCPTCATTVDLVVDATELPVIEVALAA